MNTNTKLELEKLTEKLRRNVEAPLLEMLSGMEGRPEEELAELLELALVAFVVAGVSAAAPGKRVSADSKAFAERAGELSRELRGKPVEDQARRVAEETAQLVGRAVQAVQLMAMRPEGSA